ncbi:MAG: macro domain-containing protein [Methanobacteriota archaeon]
MSIRVSVKMGDITCEVVDAVVNPSNSFGVMGGGVAYFLKKMGGSVIEDEARRKAPIHVGDACETSGGALPARFVIHASTMETPAERIGPCNVKLAVSAALSCADSLNLSSVSFPGMGTGVGGVLPDDAGEAMVSEIKNFMWKNPDSSLEEIFLVAYSDELYSAFEKWVNLLLETK